MVSGEFGDEDEGIDDVAGLGFFTAAGLALDVEEPLVEEGIGGEGGKEGFLDALGCEAVSQAVSVSFGCAGSGALSSSGHGVVTFFGIYVS